jgi:aspartyl-tRNA(Asn)/glutamyl-tRNA(Gln) amidotransferase subunit C
MSLTHHDIQKIAHLARLHVEEADIEAYAKKLSSTLWMINKLSKAETSDITPVAHSLELTQRLRDDQIKSTNEREKFQAIAPATEAGLYLVPQVIE